MDLIIPCFLGAASEMCDWVLPAMLTEAEFYRHCKSNREAPLPYHGVCCRGPFEGVAKHLKNVYVCLIICGLLVTFPICSFYKWRDWSSVWRFLFDHEGIDLILRNIEVEISVFFLGGGFTGVWNFAEHWLWSCRYTITTALRAGRMLDLIVHGLIDVTAHWSTELTCVLLRRVRRVIQICLGRGLVYVSPGGRTTCRQRNIFLFLCFIFSFPCRTPVNMLHCMLSTIVTHHQLGQTLSSCSTATFPSTSNKLSACMDRALYSCTTTVADPPPAYRATNNYY